MGRKRHRSKKEVPELDIVTFLNLMVVLIPFLLISAVFSKITILELNVPGGGSGGDDKPKLVLEVIVRKTGIEIGNGKSVVASMKKVDDKYDIATLSAYLKKLKKNNPDKTDAIILMEGDLKYEHLVLIMDAVRSADPAPVETVAGQPPAAPGDKIVLFADISIGDAS